MEDLILHPDIAEPVMTLSDRDMGTLFKALMIARWRRAGDIMAVIGLLIRHWKSKAGELHS